MSDSSWFSPESKYLLDASAETERKYIEAMRERNRQLEAEQAASREAAEALMAAARAAENRSEFELRAALSDAIDAHDAALNHVGIAQANVDRAADRMSEADAELADYGNLDQQIADWHVDQIRRNAHETLPFALANSQRDRGAVIDQLDAQHKAYDRLQLELRIAQVTLAECAVLRSRAAAHVISKSMDAIAIQMNNAMDEVMSLRRKLVSAASAWITTSDGAAPLGLSALARTAIWRQADDVTPDVLTIDAIRDWHTKLLNDPNANEPA